MLVTGDAGSTDPSSNFVFNYLGTNIPVDAEDWYTFTLTLSSQTTVTIKLNFQGSPTADLDLYLFDSLATTLLAYSISENDPTETITETLGPGTYIIAVDAWLTPDGSVDYTFDLNYGGDKGNEQEVEDWYTFTLSSQSTITATLTFEGSTSSTDFDLYLLNAAADTVLASSREDNPTSGDMSETITETLTPGTYFIGVDAFNGSADYTLTIQ